MNTLLALLLPILLSVVEAHPEAETFVQNGDPATEKLHSVIIFALPREGDHRGALGGGSILSERYILTAAHLCVNAQQFLIGYGHLEATRTRRITARSALVHSHFNPLTLENDLAVITLPSDQRIDLSIARTIAIARNVQSISSAGLLASFGFTSNDATSISDRLLVAQQVVVKNTGCESAFNRPLRPTQFCGQNQRPANTDSESTDNDDDNVSDNTVSEGGGPGNNEENEDDRNVNGSAGNGNEENENGNGDNGNGNDFLNWGWSKALQSRKVSPLSSVCFGDTGSALVRKKGDRYVAFGLLSRIPGGCNDVRPALYTQLASFSQWIEDVTMGQATLVEL